MDLRCGHCNSPIAGRARVFCDAVCCARAGRRRRVGLPENAYPEGGRRGRIAMTGRTTAERMTERFEELDRAIKLATLKARLRS